MSDRIASLALRTFAVVVVAYGISGIVLPGLWLHAPWLLGLPPLGDRGATFLFEFRFLHGREIGVGVLAWYFHDEILTSRRHNLAFAAALFAAPLGRIYSCLVDGPPPPLWLGFLAIELGMSTLIVVTTAGARSGARG